MSFSVEDRTVSVLAGPNGAGKTTTTRILATYYRADRGWARIKGLDVAGEYRQVRRLVAYQPQGSGIGGDITPEEFIVATLMTRGISYWEAKAEARRWLELLDMWDLRNRRAWNLSGGERRRAVVAATLAAPAEVYLLDEPTTGIDVEGRYSVLKAIRNAAAQGSTILVTTHNLAEAQIAADSVVFINSGVTVASGKPAALLESLPWRFKAVIDRPGKMPGEIPHIDLGDKVIIYSKARGELYGIVEELEVKIHGIQEVDLEDAYLYAVRGYK